jgi:short-subunit dehydrogenase
MNVLITGASKGIGYETVKQFAQDGNNRIVAIARNKSLLLNLQNECLAKYHNKVTIYEVDFLSASLDATLDHVFNDCQLDFDIIINNAGLLINKPFNEISVNDMLELYKVNTIAPSIVIQKLLHNKRGEKLCHIVNIGSMGGYQGSVKFPGLSIYSASKSALSVLTECLAEEYKEENVVFNCLALGSVQTEMLEKAFPGFVAQTSSKDMAKYIKEFSLSGSYYFNGKILPISKETP